MKRPPDGRARKIFLALATLLLAPGGFIALALGAAILSAVAALGMIAALAALLCYASALAAAWCGRAVRRVCARRRARLDLRGWRWTASAAELRRRDLEARAATAERDMRIFDGRNSTRGRWTQ